ncbi:MAG: sulfotransferase [Acidobacteriota bacterium]|nr:sulfotransferase [Acidobacteriota bacterium]
MLNTRPVFLVGAERSGTTLLRLMLDYHPEVAFHGEFEYIVDMVEDDGRLPCMDRYLTWLRGHRIFQDSGFTIDEALDYPTLANSFLHQKRQRDDKHLVGATVHHHYHRLLHLWPEARFLHIVRDPRDVARSTIGMGWAGNVWVGSDRWLTAERIWDELKPRLPESAYLEVRYEALIQDPRAQLETICDFLQKSFHEAMFSYAEHTTYDLPDPKLVYQWKTRLSEEEVGLVESKVGDLLSRRGYHPSGYPAQKVDDDRARHLELQSRFYCRHFRLQRYGVRLLALNKLAKVLPGDRLASWCRERFNNIDREFLK